MNIKTSTRIAVFLLAFFPACKSIQPTGAIHSAKNGFVLSLIDSLHSAYLNETRTINVYLPEGYSDTSKEKYPVIYLLDGGTDEDFIHIAGLVRYNTQPWINRFPKTIVVGIENSNRKRDFTFAVNDLDFLNRVGYKTATFPSYGGSANFISFIKNELQPFIEKHYRGSGPKTLIGESLGGLLATEILLKHRSLFNTYIIVTPSLWWGAESLITEAPYLLKPDTNENVRVYIAAAKKEEDLIMYNDAEALTETLRKNGSDKIKTVYDYLPEETHATILHQAVYNAMKVLYPVSQ